MTADRWQQIERIYQEAVARTLSQRAAFLEQACGADAELRVEVERMLSGEAGLGSFLQAPAVVVAAHDMAAERLAPGTRFGPYEIESLLGAGGMGEVYRAHDTRLKRTVAIKVLPQSATFDTGDRRRLLREAQTASALNHPNVVTIHDVLSEGGRDCIVMEYLEGRTLAEIIGRKRLPLPEVLQYGTQIASGIAAAHTAGIIHRDLKPGNVMVTKGGLKVLDFGLAKWQESARPEADTHTLTAAGTVAGTAAYMSPEQAEGKKLDSRTDIFALGCVLYEMIAGRVPFRGESTLAVLAAILHEDPPPVSAAAENIPAELDKLVQRCLRKDPDRRIQHMGDVKLALEELGFEMGAAITPAAAGRDISEQRRSWISPIAVGALIGAAVLLAAAVLWFIPAWRAPFASPDPWLRNEARLTQLTNYGGTETSGAISPDGKYFAFVSSKGGSPDVWVRRVSGGDPVQITHDAAEESDLVYPPDGESILFALSGAQRGIWRVGTLGGQPVKLVAEGRYPAPSPDGRQLAYVTATSTPPGVAAIGNSIEVAAVDGTSPRKLLDGRGIQNLRWSPDGRWLAYTQRNLQEPAQLFLADARTGEKRTLTDFTFGYIYGIGWMPDSRRLVVSRSSDISTAQVGVPSDLQVVSINGRPVRRISLNIDVTYNSCSVSGDGVRLLATQTALNREIWRVPLGPDPAANGNSAVRLLDESWNPMWIHVARDGSAVLFNSGATGSRNLWILPLDRVSPPRQLTQLPAAAALAHSAISPDNSKVAYVSFESGNADIWVSNVDGSNPTRITNDPAPDFWPEWSPDGHTLLFGRQGGLWRIAATGGEASRFNQECGIYSDWSPVTGRVVCSTSTQDMLVSDGASGNVLRRIADVGPGRFPVWSPDGRHISFVKAESTGVSSVWIADVETGESHLGARFSTPFNLLFRAGWSGDGRSVIVNRLQPVTSIVMLENF